MHNKSGTVVLRWDARWPHARLWVEQSGFETWPGTLRCVHGQDTYRT